MIGDRRYSSRLGLALVLCLVLPAPAMGDDEKQEAQQHFETGTRLFEVEDFEGAVTEFEASVRIYPTKNGWFNLANCYKAMHRYADALDAVEELERAFDGKIDHDMQRRIDDLKELIASLVGELTLEIEPDDASVLLDGRPLAPGAHRDALVLGPGEHRLEMRAPGYTPAVQRVTVHSQKHQTVRVSLKPVSGTLTVQTDVDGATVLLDGNPMGETPLDPFAVRAGRHLLEVSLNGYNAQSRTVQVAPDSWTTLEIRLASPISSDDGTPAATSTDNQKKKNIVKPLKYTSTALGAASAILTGVFYGLAASHASDFEQYDRSYATASTDEEVRTADTARLEARDKTERFAAAGLATAIWTGVFGAAAVVLFVLDNNSEHNSETISLEDGRLTVSF